jgi:hypothetical protein
MGKMTDKQREEAIKLVVERFSPRGIPTWRLGLHKRADKPKLAYRQPYGQMMYGHEISTYRNGHSRWHR